MIKNIFTLILGLIVSQSVAANLNILTDRSDIHLVEITKQFEFTTGIPTKLTFVKNGILEKAQSGDYDIMITKNSSEIVAAKDNDLLKPIQKDILQPIIGYADINDYKWFLMSYRIRAFHIRKDMQNPPLTYSDLSKPEYKDKICIRKLTHNYNLELFGTMIDYMGEEDFTKWFVDFKNNLARKPVGNDRNQVKGVYNKECDIAIANTYYRGLMLNNYKQKAWADATTMIIPNQITDELGAVALFAGVGSLSSNQYNNTFFNYLLSDETQQGLSEKNYEYPLNLNNSSNDVKRYGKMQGLNYQSITLYNNIQNELFGLRKRAYFVVKNN